jgi:glycosyltransferase involved in cell wall biosynthesis
MDSFSSKFTRILNSEDPPECIISLCSEVRTPLELKLVEKLRSKLIPDMNEEVKQSQMRLAKKLLSLEKIHVAFINDFGFYAGAGIATARQACGFALAGHQVSVVGLHPYPETALGKNRFNKWLKKSGSEKGAIRYYASTLSDLDIARNGDKDHRRIIEMLLEKENWDLVVLGNLHSDAISLSFLNPIFKRKLPIIWYAHDLDLLGGGCGYPQYYNCTQYESKCLDLSCPRPKSQYPCSANGRVERSYVLRSILHEYSSTYIACNSRWSQVQLTKRYPRRPILRIPYGVDTLVFFPARDRAALRKELGIDPTKFTIIVGADSVGRPGKGGEILDALLPAILEDAECQVISFGDYPNRPHGVVAIGYLDDEISIARVFASGDCFLNPVTIEAFGQTLLEASACGCVPVVLDQGGGVLDIVEDGKTGLVASDIDGLKSAIRRLKSNKDYSLLWPKRAKSVSIMNSPWRDSTISGLKHSLPNGFHQKH